MSPTGAQNPAQPFPHLTTLELAARWRTTIFTVSKMHKNWGLSPIKIGRRKLYPIEQVEAVERKSMAGEAA